jgi:hypothetical protein
MGRRRAGGVAITLTSSTPKGHFIKCGAAAPMSPMAGYKLDAKGKCHDAKGKMAKKEMCKA